jgi:hypothetical protein
MPMSDAAVVQLPRIVRRDPDPVATLIRARHGLVRTWGNILFSDPQMPLIEEEIERVDEQLLDMRATDLRGAVERARQALELAEMLPDPNDDNWLFLDVQRALLADLEGLARGQFGTILPWNHPKA